MKNVYHRVHGETAAYRNRKNLPYPRKPQYECTARSILVDNTG